MMSTQSPTTHTNSPQHHFCRQQHHSGWLLAMLLRLVSRVKEMSGDALMFDEFIALCDEQYEYGLIDFKNGDIRNGPGENDGSAKVLSYAALAGFDKEMTLKVRYSSLMIVGACFCVCLL